MFFLLKNTRAGIFCACTLLLLLSKAATAQTVEVAGLCISDTIVLSPGVDPPLIDGKPWNQGTGTVLGNAGVSVFMYWSESDSRWFLDFDGQPYFESAANTALPPNTGSGNWVPTVDNMDCTTGGAGPLSVSGSGTITGTNNPAENFRVVQNRPNPFKSRTTIGFNVPGGCAVQIRLSDLQGRELLHLSKFYMAGFHEETLQTDGGSGLVFCTLTTEFGTRVFTMQHLD